MTSLTLFSLEPCGLAGKPRTPAHQSRLHDPGGGGGGGGGTSEA